MQVIRKHPLWICFSRLAGDPQSVLRLVWAVIVTDYVLFYLMFFSVYWDYAMTIPLEEIVYLHCHQQGANLCVITASSIYDQCPQLNTAVK